MRSNTQWNLREHPYLKTKWKKEKQGMRLRRNIHTTENTRTEDYKNQLPLTKTRTTALVKYML
jgi:hypothetical protein